jgi:hypothetical protein
MNPRRRLGLAPAEHAPMPQWRGGLLEVDEDQPQAVFRGRPRTVFLGGLAARLPLPSMQGPISHVVQEGGLTRRYQRGTLGASHARHISHVGRRG